MAKTRQKRDDTVRVPVTKDERKAWQAAADTLTEGNMSELVRRAMRNVLQAQPR